MDIAKRYHVPVLWQEKYFWGAAKNEHFNNWYLIKTVRALLKFVHERLTKGQSVFDEHLKSSEDQTNKSTCHVHVMRYRFYRNTYIFKTRFPLLKNH